MNELTALPPSRHAGTKQLLAELWCSSAFFEGIEFRYQLKEVSESEEASVQCPRWASRGVSLTAKKDDALAYGFGTIVDDGVNVFQGRLRDAVEVAEAGIMY